MPHVIRLRGAWETAVSGEIVRHTRNFGSPGSLRAGERVWLICRLIPGPTEVFVNGQSLGSIQAEGDFSADVTDRLLPRNRLLLEVQSPGPIGEVALEIRESSCAN
jgi:hypothetical protein